MELGALKLLANLGITAVVVGMAFYVFYHMVVKIMDNSREDNKMLLDKHHLERAEWRESAEKSNQEFTKALKKHAESTTVALEKVISEIQKKGN